MTATDPKADSKIVIIVKHRYTASPERVFDAFLDPAKAKKFMFATPTGQMVRAELDPRVGGRFCFVDRRDGEDVEHVGEYLQLDRPKRLVFRFSVDKSDADRVSIDIAPSGSGCELTLTHETSAEWAAMRERIEAGWTMILENLDKTLGETS